MIPGALGNKQSGEGGQNSLTASSQLHQQLSARKFKIHQGIVIFYNFSLLFSLASRWAFASSKITGISMNCLFDRVLEEGELLGFWGVLMAPFHAVVIGGLIEWIMCL